MDSSTEINKLRKQIVDTSVLSWFFWGDFQRPTPWGYYQIY